MTIWALAGTTFQLRSTAFTVTGKETPAACVEIPTKLLPVDEPGRAVSPGTSTCNLTALFAATLKVEETTVEELGSSAAPDCQTALKELDVAAVTSVKA